MPKKNVAVKYKYRKPQYEENKESETRSFVGDFENLKYSLSIAGSKEQMEKIFGGWPIEPGSDIQLTLNTQMSQKTLDQMLAEKTKEAVEIELEEQAQDVEDLGNEIKKLA